MNKKRKDETLWGNIKNAMVFAIPPIVVLMFIFGSATFVWLFIEKNQTSDFFRVISLILQKAGTYSTLLAAITATMFMNIYQKNKEIEREENKEIKEEEFRKFQEERQEKECIKEIGHYILCFKQIELRKDYDEFVRKLYNNVIVIDDEKDYCKIERDKRYFMIVKFLTSRTESTNLKNVMAFDDEYFQNNKNKIINEYYQCCEKISYSSPLYCAAKPTLELEENQKAESQRYFRMFLKKEKGEKVIWISAINQEGFLLFIKVKIEIYEGEKKYTIEDPCNPLKQVECNMFSVALKQQTLYYKKGKDIYPLCRE